MILESGRALIGTFENVQGKGTAGLTLSRAHKARQVRKDVTRQWESIDTLWTDSKPL
jgi:hypothetical protein